MKTKMSLSIEESLYSKIEQQANQLQEQNPKKFVNLSKVVCAHIERSMKIPAEVTIQ